MPNVVWTNIKGPEHDKMTRAKIYSFLEKLREDDTSPGLHIEKMSGGQADPRARTGRVDIHLRAVLYRLDATSGERTYVYIGTFEHDAGAEYARSRILEYNPVNGIAELIVATRPETPSTPAIDTDSVWDSGPSTYLKTRFNYTRHQLVHFLGFDAAAADALLEAEDEEAVLRTAAGFENAWQQTAALGLAVGDSLEKIREDLGIDVVPETDSEQSDDDRILKALAHPASKMQFTFVDDDSSLRAIIDEGDFGAWRVFLHPEQQRYATGRWNGPFRLTGGAGTGKTVVLLHRAKHLSDADPASCVVLTTYTRALAENMKRDLDRLDEALPTSDKLGEAGILIRGIDQLVTAVRLRAGKSYATASTAVLGAERVRIFDVVGNGEGWAAAIAEVGAELPTEIANAAFFEAEYLQVVLPIRVTSEDEYLAIRRVGRRVPLDAGKRRQVWRVIEAYRERAQASGTLSWAEQAAIAAAWLDLYGGEAGVRVDHVLVDEGQDLTPAHWQFVRALAKAGENDLFLAEDTHQRIYGPPVVLARYGIGIVGRSRRLTLNYRTTEENLRYALSVLEGGEYVDSEDQPEGVAGYRSARRGPTPQVFTGESEAELNDFAARQVQSWVDSGVDPATIALLTRTRRRAMSLRDGLGARGVSVNYITSAQRAGDRPVVLTMHTSKGMEFGNVILFDAPDEFSSEGGALGGSDEALENSMRERSLRYVAASRARDVLVIASPNARAVGSVDSEAG